MMTGTTKRTWPTLVVLVCALFGVAVFITLYGTRVLDPSYTDWLMDGGTLSKGYLGWSLFQPANWQFPLGAISGLGYPQQATLAATDPVPLVATIGKLLSSQYEMPFQYMGRWGLACFALQGIFGGLICLHITRSTWRAILGSLLFVLSPILWQSTFSSAGLASHWVVLAGLLALLNRHTLSTRRGLPYGIWALLGALSIGIHAQYAIVCGIFCAGYCLYAALLHKQPRKILPLGAFLLAALVVGGLLGTFSASSALGIRFFGVSLSALWDPHNYSSILQNFSSPGDYQYIGFAFLGFGALLLCLFALVWLLQRFLSQPRTVQGMVDAVQTRRVDLIAFGFVAFFCLLLGLAQPIVYLVIAGALFVLSRGMGKGLLSVVMVLCLLLQGYDASAVWSARRMHYSRTVAYTPMIQLDSWTALMQNDAWQTVVISPAVSQSVFLPSLTEVISASGQTLSTLSFDNAAYANWESAMAEPQADMMFVFTAEELQDKERFTSVVKQIDYLYQWGDLVVGFSVPTLLPYPQILQREDIAFRFRFSIGRNAHMKGGEDIGGIRYIYPDGLSYGPYLSLQPGQYELRVTGEYLDEAAFSFTIGDGAIDETEMLSTPTERVYRLNVTRAVTDFECLIENFTSHTLYFDAMTITQLD